MRRRDEHPAEPPTIETVWGIPKPGTEDFKAPREPLTWRAVAWSLAASIAAVAMAVSIAVGWALYSGAPR